MTSLSDGSISCLSGTVTKHLISLDRQHRITLWWFDAVGSDVGQINEVTLRRARLVLGLVTVSGVKLPVREIYLSLTNHPGRLSLAIPPWVGAMSTGRRVVMLCDWELRHTVLFTCNTV